MPADRPPPAFPCASAPARPVPAWRGALQALRPAPLAIDARERLRVVAGVGLGLALVALLCQALAGPQGWAARLGSPVLATLPWLVAPLGASAVLVFGVPASPMAQPWAVVGGNTVSALAGIACVHALPSPVLAAPAAVALAVGLMLALRCLHPPGGAAALLMVLGGVGTWRFAAFPVALNSLLLVAGGIAYNQATGRRYPHPQREAAPAVPARATQGPYFSEADLDAVLARYNQVLDLPRDDLHQLLEDAELQAHGRRLASLRCADIMTREPLTVGFGSPLQEAWALLRSRQVKALPVVDRQRRVVGIVTLADFLRSADLDLHQGFDDRLRRLIRATPASHSSKHEVVGQIMSRQVRVASVDRSLAELVPIFSSTGHHHIPIIDADGRLVGIVTQTDLVRALVR